MGNQGRKDCMYVFEQLQMCSVSFPRCILPMVLSRCKSVELQLLQQSWTQMIYMHRGFGQLSLWIEQLSAWLYIFRGLLARKLCKAGKEHFLSSGHFCNNICYLLTAVWSIPKAKELLFGAICVIYFRWTRSRTVPGRKELLKLSVELGGKLLLVDPQEPLSASVLQRLNLLIKPILANFEG